MQHLLRGIDVIESTEVLASLCHELSLTGMLLGNACIFLGIGDDPWVHHLLLELLVRSDEPL